jgi:2-amino-4-hydroxy-6-hydroxymethyldihydropteridine diphosphokinase
MGDREGYIRSALKLLDEMPGASVISVSSFHETEPVGYTEQAKFINAVAKVETTLGAHELLGVCLGIESRLGRVRTITWGPRTIDLDILLYGEEVIDTDDLKVPHPLMHEREFVLVPLCEIAPEAYHPVLKKTAREMLRALAH